MAGCSPPIGNSAGSYSTETALTRVMDVTDGGTVVARSSLDISGAFDAGGHRVVVHRLEDEFDISKLC